jgi:hypothetical protein
MCPESLPRHLRQGCEPNGGKREQSANQQHAVHQ